MKTKVTQLTNNKGNTVKNQFIIDTDNNTTIFQSYNSIIVKKTPQSIELDERYYNYSKTTSKYCNQFLGCTSKEREQRIKSGEYKLTNLNG